MDAVTVNSFVAVQVDTTTATKGIAKWLAEHHAYLVFAADERFLWVRADVFIDPETVVQYEPWRIPLTATERQIRRTVRAMLKGLSL